MAAPGFDYARRSHHVDRGFLHRGRLARQARVGKLQTRMGNEGREIRLAVIRSAICAGRPKLFHRANLHKHAQWQRRDESLHFGGSPNVLARK